METEESILKMLEELSATFERLRELHAEIKKSNEMIQGALEERIKLLSWNKDGKQTT